MTKKNKDKVTNYNTDGNDFPELPKSHYEAASEKIVGAYSDLADRETIEAFRTSPRAVVIKTKVRCIVEEMITYVGDTKDYQTVSYQYDNGSLDEKLIGVSLHTSDIANYSGSKNYSKEQLYAYIISLQEILKKFN